MLKFLIMRHAEAQIRAGSDALRPLTGDGLQQASSAAKWLIEQDLIPSSIISSPYLRATQTAQTIAQGCGFRGVVRTSSVITPEDSPSGFLSLIESELEHHAVNAPEQYLVLFVSHNPLVTRTTQLLLEGVSESSSWSSAQYAFSPANIACLSCDICEPGLALIERWYGG